MVTKFEFVFFLGKRTGNSRNFVKVLNWGQFIVNSSTRLQTNFEKNFKASVSFVKKGEEENKKI